MKNTTNYELLGLHSVLAAAVTEDAVVEIANNPHTPDKPTVGITISNLRTKLGAGDFQFSSNLNFRTDPAFLNGFIVSGNLGDPGDPSNCFISFNVNDGFGGYLRTLYIDNDSVQLRGELDLAGHDIIGVNTLTINDNGFLNSGVSTVDALGPGTRGARTFVSDSVATHTAGIGAVVVGGGANAVPVYSDGTDWRIG